MTDFVPGFSYPAELNYDLPTQTPPGIKQIQLRQYQTSNIPNVITPGTEIQIDIPQIDYAFLDPTSTSLCVRGTLQFQARPYKIVANTSTQHMIQPLNIINDGTPNPPTNLTYPPISLLAMRPHAFLGKGWGMFQRYCVYANTNILTDEIQEPGLLQNYLDLLTTGRNYLGSDVSQTVNNPKLAGSNLLAVFPEAPGANARSLGGTVVSQQNLVIPSSSQNADGNYLISDIAQDAPVVGTDDCFGDCSSGCFVPTAYDIATGILTISYEISLPLLGVLGSGNDKMYPLFIGPTRISVFTEAIDKYIVAPTKAATFNFNVVTLAARTDFDLSSPNTQNSITSVEFVGNYYKCDTSAFQYVLGNLPVEGKMILRTVSFSYSSQNVNQSSSGIVDVLIPTRRASQKMLMVLCNTSNLTDKGYGSVCPNLGQNTCVLVNGVQYPQLGVNFLQKPHDAFRQTLVTLNMSYSSTVRPAISYGNWARLVSGPDQLIAINTRGIPQTIAAVPAGNSIAQAGTVATAVAPFQRRIPALCKSPVDGGKIFHQATVLASAVGAAQVEAQRTSLLFSNLLAQVPFWQGEADTTDHDLVSYTPINQDGRSTASPFTMNQNQWVHCVDTETFGRRGFLNGISTLSGSNFYQMNIAIPLIKDVKMIFFSMFDAMLLFDATTKQVSWKI